MIKAISNFIVGYSKMLSIIILMPLLIQDPLPLYIVVAVFIVTLFIKEIQYAPKRRAAKRVFEADQLMLREKNLLKILHDYKELQKMPASNWGGKDAKDKALNQMLRLYEKWTNEYNQEVVAFCKKHPDQAFYLIPENK